MLISYLILILMVLVGLGFFTLLERKLLGYMQIRKGPNKVGVMGLSQPFSDGMKLFIKELNLPMMGDWMIFLLVPIFSLFFCFLNWSLFLMEFELYDYLLGILFFLVISGMGAYITLLSGWSSNSMYAVIGSYRGVAQFISYEVVSGMIILCVVMLISGYNLSLFMVSSLNFLLSWMVFLMWVSVILAEVNRSPYDFVEGESELVSGFNVEYSSGNFSLLFMAEYGNILFMSVLSGYLYGGYMLWMFLMLMISVMIIWVRGSYPRFRYDKLMDMAWKYYLGLILGGFMFMVGVSGLVSVMMV